jgi:glycosyltransferase involved in cell wall biosynthesis
MFFQIINHQIEILLLCVKVLLLGISDMVYEFLYKSNFHINSSYFEALGVSIIEALSIGLPIIGSNVGGIPEFNIDDESLWMKWRTIT